MSVVLDVADRIDEQVDVEIAACLDLGDPKSFFLFAGAGSGKTRSLVTALEHVQRTSAEQLRARGQRVGVITYTNAASDEIKRRLRFDPLIDVRTIHSFAWSLIDGLNRDIREWLRVKLAADIAQLQFEESKGRKGTKTSIARLASIEGKTKRLANLDQIKRFVYSPTGDNRTRDALNHSDVLRITANFLSGKSAMQSILTGRYPILLIDESQDTNRYLIDALFAVQASQPTRFVLGLLGDMMQRIYNEGKEGLGTDVPASWAQPVKRLNYRCPRRIVRLINKVRSAVDNQAQQARSTASEGVVRLFVLPNDVADKPAAEAQIAARMAHLASDEAWREPRSVKTLTLEHRMAATRMGFLEMFLPLYEVETWRTSFLEGDLPVARFFARDVLSLIKAKRANDKFAVARILKQLSPLLSASTLQAAVDKRVQLTVAGQAVDALMALWNENADPTLREVLRVISERSLLEVPEMLLAHVEAEASEHRDDEALDDPDDRASARLAAIARFLGSPFSQVEPFAEYFSGVARFGTHQGVKGLEFERVMVVMDDSEAKGFMFKYEDLFGGKAPGDKALDNTRRLFYVTCSRAEKSLALVAYSSDPARVRRFVIEAEWFDDEEVILDLVAARP